MTDLHLMLLSALQGLTEFLPVSSSGHLILFSKFTTFPDQGLAFDVAVHVGSIIAVMIYFSETIWEMLKGVAKTYFIPNFKNPGSKLAWLIVIGTIPAVIAGLFLVENGTDELRSARLIGWTMLSFGIVLFIADKIGMTIRKIEHLTALDAVLIGLAQCLALIPGTSRSGATIIGGMLCGCSRTAAAEFTFFLAIPVMFGWGVLKLIKYLMAVGLAMTATEIAVLVVGIVTAFVVSVISIKFLMGYIKKNDFTAFGVYRIIVGLVVLAYFGVKVLL